jgi:exodeoxyribonuclease VII small subunit
VNQPGLQDPVPESSSAFEQSLEDLEGVVKELESGDLPLEKAIRLFEKGVALSAACRKQLDEAETRVEMLLKTGAGIKAEPMDV